ncbi:hypothetical protein MUK42_28592 [Musa troglodytarum]|uniref:Uncharacterized protein n=1 Tax=Musa troglodytarum TaxID=320322 RepID=A0A9E7GKU3_9LILI|nr:hypothetical protein MUK42_28592 [Musa troglodytarum]
MRILHCNAPPRQKRVFSVASQRRCDTRDLSRSALITDSKVTFSIYSWKNLKAENREATEVLQGR